MKPLFASLLCAAACCAVPTTSTAAALTLEPSAQHVEVGDLVDVRLWIRDLGDGVVDNYVAAIHFDASVLQLHGLIHGDGLGGNQFSCPGPTPDTCTHVGGPVDSFYDWTNPTTLIVSEGTYGNLALLQAEQLDDFIVLTLRFQAVHDGMSDITASMVYGEQPAWRPNELSAHTLVQVPEPSAAWLALAGLAAALATRPRRPRSAIAA